MDKVNNVKDLVSKGMGILNSGLPLPPGLGGLNLDIGGLTGLDVGEFLNETILGASAGAIHLEDNMMCLGDFVFKLSTVPFHTKSDTWRWRHPESSRVGVAAASQFAGRENQKIKLDCLLCPELTGGMGTVEVLVMMAEIGEAYPLIDGLFNYMGYFVIESISLNSSSFLSNGMSRSMELSVELKQIPEDDITV